MKNRTCLRTGLTVLVTAALSVSCIPGALALAQDGATGRSAEGATANAASNTTAPASTATFQKSEVVYANLAASGAPDAVYVVNRFDIEQAGDVVDHGAYASVQNLTSEAELVRTGDATVFEAEAGTLYYQGDAAQATLPWTVAISYELDGKRVEVDKLAGASGNLAIQVKTSKNAAVNSAFYDSFMMQITFTLPGDVATDVAAEGATVASAGEDRTAAFAVLPGHDGDFTLTAKVQDFSMPGAQIVALPYSSVIEMPDTDPMVEGMTDLSDAVSKLADGTSSLASGVDELTSGARDLSSGAAAFGQGLSQLSGSSSQIVNASAQIKAALASIASGLSSADFSQLGQLQQLPASLTALADALATLRQSAVAVQTGYAQALPALDVAIAAIPDAALSEQEIQSLMALAATSSNPADAATAGKLVETYAAAQKVKGTYAATSQAFVGADQLLAALAADAQSGGALAQQEAALRTMASSLETATGGGSLDQLPQLASGISQLFGEYGQFHDGLNQYASGLSALAANYGQLQAGTSSLASGTGQLATGAGELNHGMGQLNANTITLPETMKQQIAEMTADFDFPAFDPVSFMSPENVNVAEVQFVMATAAIEKPEAPQTDEPERKQTLWDRFVALFQG